MKKHDALNKKINPTGNKLGLIFAEGSWAGGLFQRCA